MEIITINSLFKRITHLLTRLQAPNFERADEDVVGTQKRDDEAMGAIEKAESPKVVTKEASNRT